MTPLVSIIVPCYNQQQYINDALQSVFDQTYTNWECIVMDDGSTDNSKDYIQQWVKKDSRFSYNYKTNGGIVETRNHAIAKANGTLILPLDGDDKIAPEYIEQAVSQFTSAPDTKLVYCNKIFFGIINKQEPCPPYSFEKMLYENQIHHAAMFRKKDFEATGGYNSNMFDGLEDWDFWLTLLSPQDKVVKLDGYFYYYRIKKISRSTEIDWITNERLILQMFQNHSEKYLQFFNPVRDHINSLHFKDLYSNSINSPEYRIGKTICYPFRLLSKVWRKIVG